MSFKLVFSSNFEVLITISNILVQALTWAAHQGHKKVIFKLLELGADKSIQTKDGQTSGEIAKNSRHSEVQFCVRSELKCVYSPMLNPTYLD